MDFYDISEMYIESLQKHIEDLEKQLLNENGNKQFEILRIVNSYERIIQSTKQNVERERKLGIRERKK